jgi:hypothetical protein
LEVVNSGATPQAGNSYKFFSATNFGGTFDTTSFPALPDGLTWVDNLAVSGSIAVSSSGSPMLVLAMTNQVLTLSWDSTSFPGFSVQAQTNNNGIGSNWADTGSGTVSPFVISKDTSSRSVFFRLFKP